MLYPLTAGKLVASIESRPGDLFQPHGIEST